MIHIETLPQITASHLVKSVDLNHHGTLYAGRMAEWVVEVGFMTARAALQCPPGNLVCARLHGMSFRKSVPCGETLVLTGSVIHAGRSSLSVRVTAGLVGHENENPAPTEGMLTFVHVIDTHAAPHGLHLTPPESPEARLWWDQIEGARGK